MANKIEIQKIGENGLPVYKSIDVKFPLRIPSNIAQKILREENPNDYHYQMQNIERMTNARFEFGGTIDEGGNVLVNLWCAGEIGFVTSAGKVLEAKTNRKELVPQMIALEKKNLVIEAFEKEEENRAKARISVIYEQLFGEVLA